MTYRYEAGTHIQFSSGEYSDYGPVGDVVLKVACDIPALVKEFRKQYVPEDKWDTPDPDEFVAWLVKTGRAESGNLVEVHLGSYGSFSPEFAGYDWGEDPSDAAS